MPAPPLRTELSDTYPNPSNATMRTGMGKLWDYVTTLLGLAGTPAGARAALSVPMSEVGLILQSGNAVTDANGSVTVTFPIAYPNGAPRVVASPLVASFGSYGVNITARSGTGFSANITLNNVGVPGLSLDWHAAGK